MPDLANRFYGNPILKPQDLRPSSPGLKIESLLNPGVFSFLEKTWLVVRVAERPEQTAGKISWPVVSDEHGIRVMELDQSDPAVDLSDPRVIRYGGQDYLTTLSHLRILCSDDGVHFREPEWPAVIAPQGDLERYGIEDCRVARIGDAYYLTFTQVSSHGVGVGLKVTRDWRSFEDRGMILPPHNKDCALFDEPVHGKYYALHRPSSPDLGGNYIWIAESEDLTHWGKHRCVAHTRGGHWDSVRIGAGAAPIRTSEGWLAIYHGADHQNRYCLGGLLLDLDQPWKVIARSEQPIMEPDAAYERTGFFGNVIFTNGHLVKGDAVTIYYGSADSVICGATLSLAEILDSLRAKRSLQR